MTEPADGFYQDLRREYLSEAPARLGELRKDLAAACAGETDAVASLKTRFHRLAGSGGSYGFPAISVASREAEQWLNRNREPDSTGFAYLGASIGRIAAAFDQAAREVGLPTAPQKRPAFGWRAHLVGGAADLAARLTFALRDAQFAVTAVSIDADPSAIPASERPDLAVLIPAPDENTDGAVARWTAAGFERRIAVALVSDPKTIDMLNDPYARLDLLVQVTAADAEVTRWARAVAREASSPTAALLVIADEAERNAVAGWLDTAGMRVNATGDAHAAVQALEGEQPDVVVLDLALPDAAGAALIRMIRRIGRLTLTPVIALTDQDTDAERERALEAGADDLMARPLSQGRLTSALIRRAARARRLEEAVRRDSLSGFLTAGTLLDEMDSLLAYARREGERISFLLLDVDHFRRVNEQLGHQTGDQVLAHLARVIRDRVRASDLVVRMGGEEFGVLFRHCGPADALVVAEQIRAAVVSNPPVVEGTPMPVRLSGGVAGYPEHAIGMRELLLAAERALRQAKEKGRDRVVVSG
jgi:diguanylate cyclase (GGDEF)-like protein